VLFRSKIRLGDGQPDQDKIWRKTFGLGKPGKWQFKVRAFDVAGNSSADKTIEVRR